MIIGSFLERTDKSVDLYDFIISHMDYLNNPSAVDCSFDNCSDFTKSQVKELSSWIVANNDDIKNLGVKFGRIKNDKLEMFKNLGVKFENTKADLSHFLFFGVDIPTGLKRGDDPLSAFMGIEANNREMLNNVSKLFSSLPLSIKKNFSTLCKPELLVDESDLMDFLGVSEKFKSKHLPPKF